MNNSYNTNEYIYTSGNKLLLFEVHLYLFYIGIYQKEIANSDIIIKQIGTDNTKNSEKLTS